PMGYMVELGHLVPAGICLVAPVAFLGFLVLLRGLLPDPLAVLLGVAGRHPAVVGPAVVVHGVSARGAVGAEAVRVGLGEGVVVGVGVGVHLGRVVDVDDRVDGEEAAEDGVVFAGAEVGQARGVVGDRKSTRLNSSHVKISYAVF